jgi:hypothetical protein
MAIRNVLSVLCALFLSLMPLVPVGQAASGLLQPSDPGEFSRQSNQSAQAKVTTPDSIPGRVPIVLLASRGVAPFHVAPRFSPGLYRPQSATFIINYIPAGTQNALGDTCLSWPAGSQAAFEYATNLWGTLLNSSVPIKIDACWASLGEGVLGHSATDSFYRNFTGAPQANTCYSVAVANAISGADQNGSDPEMHIAYSSSSSFTWYFGTDGNPPMNQYDFVSVVLHEIAHGLNFAGSMRVSSGQGSWGCRDYPNLPVIYDRFTQNGSGQALIDTGLFPNPSAQLAAQLTSNNVYFNGTYANAANGGQRPKLYAPSAWQPGSSYAHLDEIFNGTPNALMTYSLDDGEALHDPGPVTCGIFRDLGWQNPCQATSAPTATSITPNSGTSGGTVHITNLAGSNFQTGAAVRLTRSGQTDISATNVVVVGSSQITCDFNLASAAVGQWNVVVTNPDSQSGTLSNGFTVTFSGKTWNGSVSSDWHTAGNWAPSGVPASADNVVIPNVARDPIISNNNAAVNNLTVSSGAVLDLTNRQLTVEGTLVNNGTLKQTRNVAAGGTTNFMRITNLAGTQAKYYGVDISPSSVSKSAGPVTSSLSGASAPPEETVGTREFTLPATHDQEVVGSAQQPLGLQPTQTNGWVTIASQDFEGSFPSGLWQVGDNDGTTNGEYYWAKKSCRPYAGSNSGWAVGGGANGAALACASTYPINADSWMVYGPFSLADATAADLSFKLWLNTESGYDYVYRLASTNGTNFYGSVDGDSGNSGGWIDRVLDLTAVPTLGNLTGQTQVWVALVFSSDSSITYAEGAYVDNIVLRKLVSTTPAPTVTSITPSTGLNTGVVHITNLAGSNFGTGATVALTKSGQTPITATNVTVVSASQITCDFNLSGAATGQWNVVVTNPDSQSGALPNGFTVNTTTTAPIVTSITPNTGVNTGVVHITNLAGSNFQTGATVKLTRSGQTPITATNVLMNATQIICDFNLTGAAAGQWNVVVTNPDSQSGTLPNGFTVTAPSPAPVVTSITPNTGANTGVVHITNLAGSNFQTGATVKLTRSGQTPITATNVLMNATQIICDFNLTGAAVGQWNVVVTNPNSQSGTLSNGFTVTGATGVNVTVSVSGNQFCAGRTGGVKRCFDITPASALAATVRFYFTEAERNGLALNTLPVFRLAQSSWIEEPGPYARGGAGQAQYVEAQNIHAFTKFALGKGGGRVYLPLIMNQWPPVPNAPTLNPISPNPSQGGNYTVSWVAGTGPAPTSYDLEENGVVILTAYTSTSRAFTGKAIGTYTYRVRGKNGYGTGPWSNSQQVTVQAAPSGPKPGFWQSTTGVEFYVSTDRASVVKFTIYVNIPCTTLKIYRTVPSTITNNRFSFTGSYYASGTFDSASSAHGTVGLNKYYTSACGGGYITGGPWSWTATWKSSAQPSVIANTAEPVTAEPAPFSDGYPQAKMDK